MPTNIPMNPRFMFWAMDKNDLMPNGNAENVCAVPYPSDAPFESARTVTTKESASGEVVGQIVGRTRHKQSMTWKFMEPATWWRINNWLEDHIATGGSFAFYCKYFNYNMGFWEIHKCYVGNPSCKPYGVDDDETSENFGMPKHLADCKLNVIDCGIVED